MKTDDLKILAERAIVGIANDHSTSAADRIKALSEIRKVIDAYLASLETQIRRFSGG